MREALVPGTGRLEDLWDEHAIAGLDLGAGASAKAADPLPLLRYRSNLLAADLRITNFAGGDTSAKFDRPDPLTLRTRLAGFYAARTITKRPSLPRDCANAIWRLAGNGSATTTGHIIPIDGGPPDAFVR
jgi:hypothetical protein